MKPLTQEFCATIAGNDPTKTKYRQIDDNLYDNFCYDKHHNNIGSIVIQCGLPSEQTLNFDNITDQLINQVQKGNQDAINLLNSINQAIEQEKKASAITTQPKLSVPVIGSPKDETKPDVKPKPPTPPKQPPKKKDDEDKENARKCQQSIKQVNEQINRIKGRYCDMLVDKHKLRQQYKSIRNPHPEGYGSWGGHVQKYNEWKRDLGSFVSQTNLIKNCKAPKEADDWLARRAPDNPNKELAKTHNCPEN